MVNTSPKYMSVFIAMGCIITGVFVSYSHDCPSYHDCF